MRNIAFERLKLLDFFATNTRRDALDNALKTLIRFKKNKESKYARHIHGHVTDPSLLLMMIIM